ncbi:hypothetical protein MP638_003493 [Amoeboaphelidium occidentale]|nr:hypothetical protein MP638_003493 [Amoeboaphelidium occidentale]
MDLSITKLFTIFGTAVAVVGLIQPLLTGESQAPIVLYASAQRLPFIWTFLTAPFYEINALSAVLNMIFFYVTSRYVEGTLQMKEYLKFLLLISTLPTLAVSLLYFVLYALSFDLSELEVMIYGGTGVQMGLLVVLKQLIPEHSIKLFKGFVTFRVKYVPLAFFSLILIMSLLRLMSGMVQIFLAINGFLCSWIYLRFFLQDRSESFSFLSFLPETLRSILRPLVRLIYHSFVLLKILKHVPSRNDGLLGGSSFDNSSGLGLSQSQRTMSNDIQEAERRRALALKALETRLQYLQASSGNNQQAAQSSKDLSTASLDRSTNERKAQSSVAVNVIPKE